MSEAHTVRQLKALADPSRLKIVQLLAAFPDDRACADERCGTAYGACFCHLQEHLCLSAPTVSHHIKTLREAGLVEGVRVGRWTYYHLRPGAVEQVTAALQGLISKRRVSAQKVG